jgi:clan AA aspartic protease (TIGR02281 family)
LILSRHGGSAPGKVAIEKRGGTYRVPVRINDTITLPFLLDTGASDLVIPADVALTLTRAGALASSDFVGKDRYRLADGSEEMSDVVVLHEVQVGERVVRNVTATISPAQGEPLLGQSFLSNFGAVTLDYNRRVLVLSR